MKHINAFLFIFFVVLFIIFFAGCTTNEKTKGGTSSKIFDSASSPKESKYDRFRRVFAGFGYSVSASSPEEVMLIIKIAKLDLSIQENLSSKDNKKRRGVSEQLLELAELLLELAKMRKAG